MPQRQTQAKDSQGEMDDESLQQALNQINDLVQQLHRNLQFTVDKDTGRTVVRVIDAETDEVVRQIPSEELLAIARHIKESMEGDELKGAFISDTA
ncbi:MAG: hypothetical protein A2V90_09925 [Gammaproteobacteria bacterium RBG_16_57_12]|nr:MAG: hypothetical protein A2V90_09925 [Gammaproteobacteria bacterium RBG_16_57_12]